MAMMDQQAALRWIDDRQEAMAARLRAWVDINSGTRNIPGLRRMGQEAAAAFEAIGGRVQWLDLPDQQTIDSQGRPALHPLGAALRITRHRPGAAIRVFLGIHMDTVYGLEDSFQHGELLAGDRLRGPGAADAKGGLVVMLMALEALEKSAAASGVSWEVLINPDEEIGSPGSIGLLREAAGRNDLGLVYEPVLQSGALASERKGSGNFTVVVRGRSAHAGRDPEAGRNAMRALVGLLGLIDDQVGVSPGCQMNLAKIEGGSALNVVPDLAIGRFNLRIAPGVDADAVTGKMQRLVESMNRIEGYTASLHGTFLSPPKAMSPALRNLMGHLETCGRELGSPIQWQPTGGVCDGNKLAAAGLVNIDTLGVRGTDIHSPGETAELSSLSQKAKLSALLLMKLGSGEIRWPG